MYRGELKVSFQEDLTLCSYAVVSRVIKAAASPFKGSDGFGYKSS